MAINSQKLLPQAKLTSTKVNVEKKNVLLKKELINIRKTLINIDKLLLSNSLFKRKETELKRKDTEKQKFKEKETKLEKKKENEITKDNEPSVPQLGIFDRINRFITFTFLGFLFNKFSKYLPKILEFIKKIQPVAEFIESFVGNVFNGIINFIDFGYSASKKVSNFVKQLGGENFQKTFDEFSGNLTKFINLAIVVGMATMGGTDFGLGKTGGKPVPGGAAAGASRRSGISTYLQRDPQTKIIERKFGNDAARMYEARKAQGGSASRAFNDVKKRFKPLAEKFGTQRGLAGGTGKSGKVFSKGFKQSGSRFTTKLLGKAGKRLAGKVFGRIPIIGGLVDFLFALWSGEPVGRAAAKGVGATIGSALGTFIPIPFAGTILGGILGDIVGGALYDTIVGSRPERKKVQGRSRGGPITRGKRKVSGVVKRTVRVTKSPPKVPPVKPGESIGGKKNLQKIFPEPTGQQKGKTVNSYGFLTDTANSFLKTDIAGALGAVFIKPFLGQLPTKEDYKNFGLAMNIWISNARSKGLIGGNATGGFADGGIINNGMMGDISKWAEKSIEEMIKNKVTDAINDLRKNLGLKSLSSTGPVSGDMGDAGNIIVSSDQPDFWLLATAALFEGISAQGYADVAQAIYNRVAMPGDPWKTGGSIRTAILNPTQFQPVREKGGVAAWSRITDKQSAIAYTQSQGRTQAQLETAASALLDTNRQRSAKTFVGPRDSFRSISYEDKKNHIADDTEVRREGHAFGFEPRGATIAAFRSGQLRPAEINRTIVSGDVKFGSSDFIQGNSGESDGVHYHIGTTKPGDPSGPAAAAFNVIKYFLGKKSIFIGRSEEFVSSKATDDEIRKIIQRGQAFHRQTEIDIQVGGAYGQGNRVAFPLQIKNHKFEPGGYGMKANIVGVNAFVGHGRYTKDGKLAQQNGTVLSKGAPDYYFKDGGTVGKIGENIKSLQNFPSYDQGSTFAILPIETIRTVPIQSPSQNKIAFTGGGGGVNSNDTNKSRMFVG